VPAASVLAMMGAFDLVGTTLSGYLSDRYDNRKLLFWYYGLRGLSLFWLPFSTFTLYGLSIFAAKRARQINDYYAQLGEGLLEYVGPLVEPLPKEKPLSIALREINAGLLEHTEGE